MSNGGTGTLDYQIYQDVSRTLVWGNTTVGTIMTIDRTADGSGAISGSSPMYGHILSGQDTEPDGTYSRSMSGGGSQRLTWTTSTGTNCNSVSSGARNYNFNATATISNNCTINATTLNFGSQNDVSANRDSTGTLTIRCTNSSPYQIGLGAGLGVGATVTARKMTSAASNTINYYLYRDTGRTIVWGNTAGTNTVSGTGEWHGSERNDLWASADAGFSKSQYVQ
jgi:spore coat protein U-like protein